MTKWFISIKPSICTHLTTIYSRCWANYLIYVFSTAEKPSTQIYRLWGDPQAGKIRVLCGARRTVQVSRSPPVKAWSSSARSLPVLCQKDCKPATCSFELLALGFPTLNSFSSELISKFCVCVFFPYVIKPWGNKGKNRRVEKDRGGKGQKEKEK